MQFNDFVSKVKDLLKRDGVEVARSAGLYRGISLPAAGETFTIKAKDMNPTITDGKISWTYGTSDKGLEVSNSMLFGRHYALESGRKPMRALVCRTEGFDALVEGTDYEIVREDFGGKSQKNVVVFLRDITVTVKDGGTVFVPKNGSWDGATVDCSERRENYLLLELK
jgi:hypothetical protein